MSTEVVLFDPMAIESQMKIEASRLNIQNLLDGISAITWTRENVTQDLLAPAREAVSKLKAFKDAGKRPHLDANSAYEKMYKELTDLIIGQAEQKAAEKKKLAIEIEKERAQIEAEKNRIAGINNEINRLATFYVGEVVNCHDDAKIVAVEKAIGAQLSRKAFFAEFYDDFVAKIKPIQTLIGERKDLLRQKAKLEKKADTEDVSEKAEDIEIGLMQNQVEAYIASEYRQPQINTYVGESTAPVVVPSRRQWKFEVTDINLMMKKHPELITIEANEAAIRQMLSDYRKKGELKDGIDINLPGLRFYQDKIYK
jgi:hypothetical protein